MSEEQKDEQIQDSEPTMEVNQESSKVEEGNEDESSQNNQPETPKNRYKPQKTASSDSLLDGNGKGSTRKSRDIKSPEERVRKSSKARPRSMASVDERELAEAIITPIYTEEIEAPKRLQPKDPYILTQSIYRMRKTRRKYKKILKRKYIATEIVTTEKTYIGCLSLVVECYWKPLLEKNIVSKKDLDILFNGVEDIYHSNLKFLDQLEPRLEKWNIDSEIGDIFLDMTKTFEVYTNFVNNYEKAVGALKKLKQNTAFVAFVSEIESQKRSNKLTLNDILIMPIQRIPRYVLQLEMIYENTPPTHPDRRNLELSIDEAKRVGKYIDQKKGEAMSKLKVGEIQSAVLGDVPSLQTDSRMFIKETTLATITNNLRCFRHIFLFNDAILICLPSTILPPKKPSYDFELFIQIQTINLVSPIPNEDFNLIKGSNYEDPNVVMGKIQKFNTDIEIERRIEQSAAKLALLYKQEANTKVKKAHIKDATEVTETKIEQLSKQLKHEQEQMRLFEPRYGLLISTSLKTSLTLVLRSESQREEWIKEINYLRTKLGQFVNSQAELQTLEKQKTKKEGWFSSLTKDVANSINRTVVKSVQVVNFITKGMSSDLSDVSGGGVKMLKSSQSMKARSPSSDNLNDPEFAKRRLSRKEGQDEKRNSKLTNSKSTPSFLDINDPLKSNRSSESVLPFDSHVFLTRSFKKPTHCDICGEFIWGLGREGMKCSECSFRSHRKCAKEIKVYCSKMRDVVIDQIDDENEESDIEEEDEEGEGEEIEEESQEETNSVPS